MVDKIAESQTRSKRSKISQSDIPAYTVTEALRVPRAIAENYASDPTRPLDVAAALVLAPTSTTFRMLCGAALGYGFTDGGPNAAQIGLTDRGLRVTKPLSEGDDLDALREAALAPTIASKFYAKYDGSPLPTLTIARNVLESIGVPADRTESVFSMLRENAEVVGFIKRIKDKEYVDLSPASMGSLNQLSSSQSPMRREFVDSGDDTSDVESAEFLTEKPPVVPVSGKGLERAPGNAIFVGHGSSHVPLDQLIKILEEYGIPYKVAKDEPNRARPIPVKVAETMNECGAAILLFTGDKQYFDGEGHTIMRPSENVSHELGAASILYQDRIIIFKEKGIELASNFSNLGYIEFEKDRLSEKGLDLFRELRSMKILQVSIG